MFRVWPYVETKVKDIKDTEQPPCLAIINCSCHCEVQILGLTTGLTSFTCANKHFFFKIRTLYMTF